MEESNEHALANVISADFVFCDFLEFIFQYLKIKDLSNASSVCKLWRDIALKEIPRRGPERILMPSIFSEEFQHLKFHAGNLLNAKPYVAILFTGPGLRKRPFQVETEVLEAYEKQFPHYLATVGVDRPMMDEILVDSCSGSLDTTNGILGLFLPLYNDININVVLSSMNTDPNDKILECLPEASKNSKVIFIMINSPRHKYFYRTLGMIQEKYPPKSYTLWGGVFTNELKAIECNKNNNLKEKLGMLFLCMAGPSIESWSTVIHCTIDKREIDKKLLEFRATIQCRRITMGLVSGPRYIDNSRSTPYENMYKNHRDLMRAVKRCFPDIPFTGVFNFACFVHFGVDSSSEDNKQRLRHDMSMCLLIITYN